MEILSFGMTTYFFSEITQCFCEIWYYGFPLERWTEIKIRAYGSMRNVISILSVRDRVSLIDVLNENQRMQQWWRVE
jgi:hypothetical protein